MPVTIPVSILQNAACFVVFFHISPAKIEKLTGAAATCCNVKNRFVNDLLGIRKAGISVI